MNAHVYLDSLNPAQRRAWPLAAQAGARPASSGPKIDVRAKMRGIWG